MTPGMNAETLLAAARALENTERGRLLWRRNGSECRLTAPDTMTVTMPGGAVAAHRVVGVDLMEAFP
jgi:hypothetical protein